MNKKLKRFLFITIGIVVVAALGIGGYFLIGNLSAVTISDLRIVAYDGTQMKNTNVYLIDETHNQFDIFVNIDSTGSYSSRVTSSNKDVATVEKNGDGYTVKYHSVGKTTITAYSALTATVHDSFVLTVSEDFVADVVIDEKTDNVITLYGNGKTNELSYVATGVLANNTSNNSLLRVVDDYDKNVIRSVKLDQAHKKIYIATNIAKEDSSQMINLQSYYIDDAGEEHIIKNFVYTLDVIGYNIKEIQLLVSQDHHFENRTNVYLEYGLNKDKATYDKETEKVVDEIYLTKNISTIYFMTRVVYTDGTMEYTSAQDATLTSGFLGYVKPLQITSSFWAAQVQSGSAAVAGVTNYADEFISISYTIEKTAFGKTIEIGKTCRFHILFMLENQPAYNSFTNNKLYKLVDEKYYEYVYWDTRYERNTAITDAEGRIVGFSDGNPVFD